MKLRLKLKGKTHFSIAFIIEKNRQINSQLNKVLFSKKLISANL